MGLERSLGFRKMKIELVDYMNDLSGLSADFNHKILGS